MFNISIIAWFLQVLPCGFMDTEYSAKYLQQLLEKINFSLDYTFLKDPF